MSENLDRDEVLYLLDKLNSDDDTEVLQSAKKLKNNLKTAGVTWDDLLLPYEENENLELNSTSMTEDGSNNPKSGDVDLESKTMALIDDLLSDSNRSEEMREELEEYKTDIKEGDFTEKDHQYVRALHQRLSK